MPTSPVVSVAALVLAMLVPSSTIAQTDTAETPRTAWGAPDLGGVWDDKTRTPLERPERFGDREFLTAEEAAELDAAEEERQRLLWEAPSERTTAGENVDRRAGVGEVRGAPGSYNQFWFETGDGVAETNQTSLVVDSVFG